MYNYASLVGRGTRYMVPLIEFKDVNCMQCNSTPKKYIIDIWISAEVEN